MRNKPLLQKFTDAIKKENILLLQFADPKKAMDI
jgi:hypothetical protein